MAESIIQPATDQNAQAIKSMKTSFTDSSSTHVSSETAISHVQPHIIWTPTFIVIFTLTLVVGLSIASLLTQGWSNHYYVAEWVLLPYTALVFSSWLVVVARARSPWIRIGASFGGLWSIFTVINFTLSLLAVDPSSSIIAHLNAATNSALLGCYSCLSIAHTPSRRWDTWFFRYAPVVGIGVGALVYLLTPADARSLNTAESTLAAVALYLCIAVWWLRPSCWKTQPAPTFLFGVVPVILLLLALPNFANAETNFFFLQVCLLSLLLGIIRVLQGETSASTDNTLHSKHDEQRPNTVVE